MSDDEFVRSFEALTLPKEQFRHKDHVRLAFLLLCREPLPRALERFTGSLKRFAASLGKAELYHETITLTYMLLIEERRHRGAPDQTFEDFARANPDLLTWRPSVLARYYREETLASDRARRSFVMPDRLLALEAAQLEDEPGRPHDEGGGDEEVGEGHEEGEEAHQAEAQRLGAPAGVPAELGGEGQAASRQGAIGELEAEGEPTPESGQEGAHEGDEADEEGEGYGEGEEEGRLERLDRLEAQASAGGGTRVAAGQSLRSLR